MSATKEKVLQLLQESFDQFRSGQEISAKLDVTRASVWKAIRNLQREGYQIEAVNNRGYRLMGAPDDLNADQIREYLIMYAKEDSVSIPEALLDSLHVYTTVGSTNTVISQFPAPAMVVSEEQTEGRGRRGRSFHSPIGNGIYMSLLLYPRDTIDLATGFTCMMAVAVVTAVKNLLHIELSIKWVNDLLLGNKKVCGILTEGNVSVEDNAVRSVTIGMGLNVYLPSGGFPEELRDIAGSLLPSDEHCPGLRNRLCAAILCEFFRIYNANDRGFIKIYQKRSMLIGKRVEITDFTDRSHRVAYVEQIDEHCHLLVRYEDGTKETLSSGEVSVSMDQ